MTRASTRGASSPLVRDSTQLDTVSFYFFLDITTPRLTQLIDSDRLDPDLSHSAQNEFTMAMSSSNASSTPSCSNASDNDYCSQFLSPHVVEKLQAGAFRSLCQHLQERSDQVANIDLMTLSGFCRNCLAKVSSNGVCSN